MMTHAKIKVTTGSLKAIEHTLATSCHVYGR